MGKVTYGKWMNKQLTRLESQRVRLRKELDNDITLHERLQVEKMILDLDSKISSFIIKIETSKQGGWDKAMIIINDWIKDQNGKYKYSTLDDIFSSLKGS